MKNIALDELIKDERDIARLKEETAAKKENLLAEIEALKAEELNKQEEITQNETSRQKDEVNLNQVRIQIENRESAKSEMDRYKEVENFLKPYQEPKLPDIKELKSKIREELLPKSESPAEREVWIKLLDVVERLLLKEITIYELRKELEEAIRWIGENAHEWSKIAGGYSKDLDQTEANLSSSLQDLKNKWENLSADKKKIGEDIIAKYREIDDYKRNLRNKIEVQKAKLESLITGLSGDVPLTLLPVRLETRFKDSQLLVRIYPDDIHQDSHQPILTDLEQYWRGKFKRTPKSERGEKWAELVSLFGARRAAYIAAGTDAGDDTARSHSTRTELLPDRWRVVGYTRGQDKALRQILAKWGNLIPHPIQTGLRLIEGDKEGDFFDAETQWIKDFDAAEQKGMAIRIGDSDLCNGTTWKDIKEGISLLLVYGVKGTLSTDESAELMADTLSAHAFTWGLGLPSQGTATNNTEKASTPYTSAEQTAVATQWLIDGLQLSEQGDSDGERLARALGIKPSALARAESATTVEQQEAKAMNTVLFPATLGYFLRHVFGANLYNNASAYDAFWRYFADNVRGCGPLPILRVHDQPYGVLPVSTLEQPDGLRKDYLGPLLDLWRALPPDTGPHLDPDDPNNSLAHTLSQLPSVKRYLVRHAVGAETMQFLLKEFDTEGEGQANKWKTKISERHSSFTDSGQWTDTATLLDASFDKMAQFLDLPLVQRKSNRNKYLKPNYIKGLIETIRHGDLAELYREHSSNTFYGQTAPLLLRLLRHSLLLLVVELGGRIAKTPVPRESEIIDLDGVISTPTGWRTLKKLPGHPDSSKLVLQGVPADFVEGLKVLSELTVDRLEMLMTETLDLASHRLDAWLTSISTYRLEKLRQSKQPSTGLYLGGYGWVENLKPRRDERMSPGGFIHAPSTTHAAAAAILRCGHLSSDSEDVRNLCAVDLSSLRVRRAQELLDGVRKGQPLGALLGYRFERSLHDRGLDRFISDFRAIAPLVSSNLDNTDNENGKEAIAPRNVVDGLALLRFWQKNENGDISSVLDEPQLEVVLSELEEAVDALSDLLVSESVYQTVRGNSLRSGASLDALSRGEKPPAEIEIARTSRSGVALNHKLLVLMDGVPTHAENWGWNDNRPRADIEPALNHWVGRILGAPDRFGAIVRFHGSDGNEVAGPNLPQSVTLDEFNLAPLDVIALSAPFQTTSIDNGSPDLSTEDIAASALARLLSNLLPDTHDIPPGTRVTLDYNNAPDGKLPLVALFELARVVRALLSNAKPLLPAHFTIPDETVPLVESPELLQGRVNGMVADNGDGAFNIAKESLRNAVGDDPPSVPALREALLQAAAFMAEAVPVNVPDSDEHSALKAQAKAVYQRMTQRADQLKNTDDYVKLKIMAGSEYPILSPLKSPEIPAEADGFRAFWGKTPQSKTPQEVTPTEIFPWSDIFAWLGRAALLREQVGQYQAVMILADTLSDGVLGNYHVIQLPHKQEKWVGLDYELEEDETFPGGRMSIVIDMDALSPDAPSDAGAVFAGLYIDEWAEVVPSRHEVTGVAFHYDAPQSAAPQAVLLALLPEQKTNWDPNVLADVLCATHELTRMRLLSPGQIAALEDLSKAQRANQRLATHLLPALFFAQNDEPDTTVSLSFKS